MNFLDVYYETIASKMKSRKSQDEFLLAILRFYYEGEEPSFRTEVADVAFAGIRYSLERARAGRLGGQANGEAKCEANLEAKCEANAEANVEAKSEKEAKQVIGIDIGIKKESTNVDKKKDSSSGKRTVFKPPSVGEVREYVTEKGYSIDPEQFVDFYASKGWMVGKNRMKDWKAAVRNWQRMDNGGVNAATQGDYENDPLLANAVTVNNRTDGQGREGMGEATAGRSQARTSETSEYSGAVLFR